MGTSSFAIPVLEKLLKTKHDIIGVFTKKPKNADRGQKLQASPIFILAEKNKLNIFTPITFKNGKNIDLIEQLKPDLIVVVSYGLILTKEVLNSSRFGAINIHPSLLPKWRGCAPLERSLMSDDKETGVCVMQVTEGLDDGNVLKCEKLSLNKEIDIEDLTNYLSNKGSELLIDVINDIDKNRQIPKGIEQNHTNATFADKITNEDAKINFFTDSIELIQKKIKTLWNSVGVFINHNNNKIKILKADFELVENIDKNNIGKVINSKNFYIQGLDGVLKPLILQKEGKKAINVKDFLNGYKVSIADEVF